MVENIKDIDCEEISIFELYDKKAGGEYKYKDKKDNKEYLINVVTHNYLDHVIASNQDEPNPDLKQDDKLMPYSGPLDPDEICKMLISTPFEDLLPYLTELFPPKHQ
jgi:hypothetical protein